MVEALKKMYTKPVLVVVENSVDSIYSSKSHCVCEENK